MSLGLALYAARLSSGECSRALAVGFRRRRSHTIHKDLCFACIDIPSNGRQVDEKALLLGNRPRRYDATMKRKNIVKSFQKCFRTSALSHLICRRSYWLRKKRFGAASFDGSNGNRSTGQTLGFSVLLAKQSRRSSRLYRISLARVRSCSTNSTPQWPKARPLLF